MNRDGIQVTAMYSLRGCGGNHFGMFAGPSLQMQVVSIGYKRRIIAGTRSDFIITQHPEFNLGRVASEQGRVP